MGKSAAAPTGTKAAGTNTAGTNTAGINQLTDQVIASDLLILSKASVKMVASAITESSTPAVRNMLKKQLDQAISFQEQVGAYIADRGWFNANDMEKQLETDMKKAQETMSMLK